MTDIAFDVTQCVCISISITDVTANNLLGMAMCWEWQSVAELHRFS